MNTEPADFERAVPVRRVGQDGDNSGGTIKAVPSFIILDLKRSPSLHSVAQAIAYLPFSVSLPSVDDLLTTAKTVFGTLKSPAKIVTRE